MWSISEGTLNPEITNLYFSRWNWVIWRIDCPMYGVPGAKNTSYRVEVIPLKACSQNLAQVVKLRVLLDACFWSLRFMIVAAAVENPAIACLRATWFFSSRQPTLYTWTREIRIKLPHRTPISTLEQYDYFFLEKNKSCLCQGASQALHLHFRWCLLVWQKRLPPRPQNDQCSRFDDAWS